MLSQTRALTLSSRGYAIIGMPRQRRIHIIRTRFSENGLIKRMILCCVGVGTRRMCKHILLAAALEVWPERFGYGYCPIGFSLWYGWYCLHVGCTDGFTVPAVGSVDPANTIFAAHWRPGGPNARSAARRLWQRREAPAIPFCGSPWPSHAIGVAGPNNS